MATITKNKAEIIKPATAEVLGIKRLNFYQIEEFDDFVDIFPYNDRYFIYSVVMKYYTYWTKESTYADRYI